MELPGLEPPGLELLENRHFVRLLDENLHKTACFVRFGDQKASLCTDFAHSRPARPPASASWTRSRPRPALALIPHAPASRARPRLARECGRQNERGSRRLRRLPLVLLWGACRPGPGALAGPRALAVLAPGRLPPWDARWPRGACWLGAFGGPGRLRLRGACYFSPSESRAAASSMYSPTGLPPKSGRSSVVQHWQAGMPGTLAAMNTGSLPSLRWRV